MHSDRRRLVDGVDFERWHPGCDYRHQHVFADVAVKSVIGWPKGQDAVRCQSVFYLMMGYPYLQMGWQSAGLLQ